MPLWSDFFKIFSYKFEDDPLSKRKSFVQTTGAGVSRADAIPDIRGDGTWGGGGRGAIRLRDSNEFIDLSTVTNRQSRYKEYQRLRSIAEIESAMTIYADETCLAGDTLIPTLFFGDKTIQWLAENKAEEEFLVYCWDFKKEDYSLGWAFSPRLTKKAKTLRIMLDDGTDLICTHDHRILNHNMEWKYACELKQGNELIPFYRLAPHKYLNRLKTSKFPRIFTFSDGWKHERQFIDEWKMGKSLDRFAKVNQACRIIAEGITCRETARIMKHDWHSIEDWLHKDGFTFKEIRNLGKKEKSRRIIGIQEWKEMDVYDMSVKDHYNFCTTSTVVHNCQKDDDGKVFTVDVDNDSVKEELEFLFFNRNMLNFNHDKMFNLAKRLFINGDYFMENCINPEDPKQGILRVKELPPECMYRIETNMGRLVEFQQGKEGPDYEALKRAPVTQATDAELMQATASRFHPEQIIHFRIGDDRENFYPYGQSLLEPARGPAHQLRMMEDAMVVYRLTRSPERRVFYIDTGSVPPFRAAALLDKIKDQFRKKKTPINRGTGASSVEERWSPMSADEDFWLPTRPNSNTRIETLPGAANLGEIDDTVFFRNKLMTALNFPKNYFYNEDVSATKMTLSNLSSNFAKLIERLQGNIETGLLELAIRHLKLRGFPEESYEDLMINLTPPSAYRELNNAEVLNNRINVVNSLKSAGMFADFDLMTKYMKYSEEEAQELIARAKIQKLEDLRLQIIAQNPSLFGIGNPASTGNEQEIGSEVNGPSPMLAPPGGEPTGNEPPPEEGPSQNTPPQGNSITLPKPTKSEIKKYDLEIQSYSSEADHEDIDFSEV